MIWRDLGCLLAAIQHTLYETIKMRGDVPRQAALLVLSSYWKAKLRQKRFLIQRSVACVGTGSTAHTEGVAAAVLLGRTQIFRRSPKMPEFPRAVLLRRERVRLLHAGGQGYLPGAVWRRFL